MQQLCNLSNHPKQLALFAPEGLAVLLKRQGLSGVEMFFGGNYDDAQLNRKYIKGVHLPFYLDWLYFWQEDKARLRDEFGSLEAAYSYYGGSYPERLIELYVQAVRQAATVGAAYVVFHVSQADKQEIFTYRFRHTDEEVIRAAADIINAVFNQVSTDMMLLCENLWWPGLTLCDRIKADLLLSLIEHKPTGFMFDTGHFMNTCRQLNTQAEGIEYIMQGIARLGTTARHIRGIHLHYSLSGRYVLQQSAVCCHKHMPQGAMPHILRIDEHKPFSDANIRRIIDMVQPDFLVHEFLYGSRQDLCNNLKVQCQALQGRK